MILAAFSLSPLASELSKDRKVSRAASYLIEAQVARVCGLVLVAWRLACFSPGERSSSLVLDDFLLMLLLLGVNFLSRVDMELVVEEERIEEVSAEGFLSEEEVEGLREDIVVVGVGGGWYEGWRCCCDLVWDD